jgi:BirA family biotin operon repressor/biotin-[acetyl-CoA-carboxylase] ligase
LSHNSSFSFAQHHLHLSEVPSTNDLARQLAEENLVAGGYIITTDFQTKGRGQDTSGWESERGKNILCSMALDANLAVEQQVYLNLCICLGVFDFIRSQVPDEKVNIKWPNDIYLNGSKVSGILIENSVQGKMIKQTIIGIGVNINQQLFANEKATSLAMVTGKEHDIQFCTNNLLSSLEFRFNQLLQGDFVKLREDYHACFYRRNMGTPFKANGEVFEGIPVGIDEAGRLVVKVQNEDRFFNVKEIVWL